MIVVPEKVVFIKIPRTGSSTIADLFWSKYDVNRLDRQDQNAATAMQYFLPLYELATKVPVINGNWFFNRASSFGWHASHKDLIHIFGEQLNGYQWITSVRHPVPRLFSVFSFQVVKGRISGELTAAHFEEFCHRVFAQHSSLTLQQVVHTWPQTHWLPPADQMDDVIVIRQEQLAADLANLSDRIRSFRIADYGMKNQSFAGDLAAFVKPHLARQIEAFYASDMDWLGFEPMFGKALQVA